MKYEKEIRDPGLVINLSKLIIAMERQYFKSPETPLSLLRTVLLIQFFCDI